MPPPPPPSSKPSRGSPQMRTPKHRARRGDKCIPRTPAPPAGLVQPRKTLGVGGWGGQTQQE